MPSTSTVVSTSTSSNGIATSMSMHFFNDVNVSTCTTLIFLVLHVCTQATTGLDGSHERRRRTTLGNSSPQPSTRSSARLSLTPRSTPSISLLLASCPVSYEYSYIQLPLRLRLQLQLQLPLQLYSYRYSCIVTGYGYGYRYSYRCIQLPLLI